MKFNSDFRPDKNNLENDIHHKLCAFCGAPLPKKIGTSYCERCRERALFQEVKDFIRSNDVNEFQVAAHFNIPLRIVKKWINEGRIEYKETPAGIRSLNNHLQCEKCGAPVTFGTLCSKCLKQLNKNIHGYDMQKAQEDDRMFFLDNTPSKNRKN